MITVENYITTFPPEIQGRLRKLREVFFEVIPQTHESIRYNMPAYTVGKRHLYFAAYKQHIGLYPIYRLSELEIELQPFRGKGTKDALHFPHKKPLPLELVKRIITLTASEG